jgi:hypothetical protein
MGAEWPLVCSKGEFMFGRKKTGIRFAVLVGLAAVAVGGAGGPAVAAETGSAAPSVAAAPETGIAPPAGSRLIGLFTVLSGTQTYTCVGAKFVAPSTPEAQLIGLRGRLHHFAGPSWQSVRDGSLVTATKLREKAVTGSIPELLLQVNSHSGAGLLSTATYIQRLHTSGGVAPTTACTDGAKASVPYHAIYAFWSN